MIVTLQHVIDIFILTSIKINSLLYYGDHVNNWIWERL